MVTAGRRGGTLSFHVIWISLVVHGSLLHDVAADPETVDGLMKRNFVNSNTLARQPLQQQQQQQQPTFGLSEAQLKHQKWYFGNRFAQDSLGRNLHPISYGQYPPKAFGSFLSQPQPQQQQPLQQRQLLPQQQQLQQPIIPQTDPRQQYVLQPQQQQLLYQPGFLPGPRSYVGVGGSNTAPAAPRLEPALQGQVQRRAEQVKPRPPETLEEFVPAFYSNQAEVPPPTLPPTETAAPNDVNNNIFIDNNWKSTSTRLHFKYLLPTTTTKMAASTTTTTTKTTAAPMDINQAETKKSQIDEASTQGLEPHAAMLKQVDEMAAASRSAFNKNNPEEESSRQNAAAIVIGFAFVGAFIGAAACLATQSALTRLRQKSKQNMSFGPTNRHIRSPNEEDQTPPELRSCGQPTFVQPDPSSSRQVSPTGTGASGFISGKLIFHDPPGNYLRSNGTQHLPAAATLGAIPKQKMILPAPLRPSLATHPGITSASSNGGDEELLSPMSKYKEDLLADESTEDDEDEEDEQSDDTVYECPGLASAKGGIVIKNPFFMANGSGNDKSAVDALPPPIQAVKANVPNGRIDPAAGQLYNNNHSSKNFNY